MLGMIDPAGAALPLDTEMERAPSRHDDGPLAPVDALPVAALAGLSVPADEQDESGASPPAVAPVPALPDVLPDVDIDDDAAPIDPVAATDDEVEEGWVFDAAFLDEEGWVWSDEAGWMLPGEDSPESNAPSAGSVIDDLWSGAAWLDAFWSELWLEDDVLAGEDATGLAASDWATSGDEWDWALVDLDWAWDQDWASDEAWAWGDTAWSGSDEDPLWDEAAWAWSDEDLAWLDEAWAWDDWAWDEWGWPEDELSLADDAWAWADDDWTWSEDEWAWSEDGWSDEAAGDDESSWADATIDEWLALDDAAWIEAEALLAEDDWLAWIGATADADDAALWGDDTGWSDEAWDDAGWSDEAWDDQAWAWWDAGWSWDEGSEADEDLLFVDLWSDGDEPWWWTEFAWGDPWTGAADVPANAEDAAAWLPEGVILDPEYDWTSLPALVLPDDLPEDPSGLLLSPLLQSARADGAVPLDWWVV